MKRDRALVLLGLDKCLASLTPEIVQTAFRTEAKRVHPDANGRHMQGPAVDLDELTKARDFLLQNLADDDSACKLCHGLGMVRGTMGHRACVACSGMGVRR